MADSATPIYNFTLPEVGASKDTWGGKLNSNWNALDALLEQIMPPGMVAAFARTSTPTGWLFANGAAVSRTTYAKLFAAVGTKYGVGDGATTFNLPDYRNRFLRAANTANDAGVGVAQADDIKSHQHSSGPASVAMGASGNHTHGPGTLATATEGNHAHGLTGIGTSNPGNHNHNVNIPSSGAHSHDNATTSAIGNHSHSVEVTNSGSHTHADATTSAAGNHSHKVAKNGDPITGGGSGPIWTQFAGGDSDGRYQLRRQTGTADFGDTDNSGNHTHTVPTPSGGSAHTHTVSETAAGGHSHTVSTPSGGSNHSHTVNEIANGGHTHTLTGTMPGAGSHSHAVTAGVTAGGGDHTHTLNLSGVNTGATGGDETRPINTSVLVCIKA